MFKKILFTIILSIFAISCSSLTAQERFEKGDYIGSLEKTVEQMRNKKAKEEEKETREVISNRVRIIENIYKNSLSQARDDYAKSTAYFNIWELVEVVGKNPELRQFSTLHLNDNYSNLKSSVDYALRYVNYAPRERVHHLVKFVKVLRKRDVKNSEYGSLYEILARRTADIFVDVALNYEYNRDLENAKNNYYNAYNVYSEFSSNYKNSRVKYEQLDQEIKLQKAEELFDSARSYYDRKDFQRALDVFERAKSEFRSLGAHGRVRDIDVYIDSLKYKVREERFQSVYNKAWENYSEAERETNVTRKLVYYNRALDLFKESLTYSTNNAKFYEIQKIMKTIETKVKYFERR